MNMNRILKKYINSLIVGLVISSTIISFSAPSVAATTSCDSIVNKTLKNKCTAQKAQEKANADAAAAAAVTAKQLQTQIDSINVTISKLNADIAKTITQISDTELQITSLEKQIKALEEDLATEKTKMNQLISSWYMQGTSGLLESVMSSNNISDVVDQQQQYDSIKEQLNTTIDQIKADETSLSNQKNDQLSKKRELNDLKSQKESSKSAATSQTQQKNSLLSMTLTQQQQYINAANAAKNEIAAYSAQDLKERQDAERANNAGIISGGTGGYPYINLPKDSATDDYGFFVRECTSYAAWYWNYKLGKKWYRGDGPSGTGDARNWATLANNQGYSVSKTPRVGAIITWTGGTYGHVAIVEKINSNGTVDASDYNWYLDGTYKLHTNFYPGDYMKSGDFNYIY